MIDKILKEYKGIGFQSIYDRSVNKDLFKSM